MRCSSVWNSMAVLAALLFAGCAGAPPGGLPATARAEGIVAVDGERPGERRVLLVGQDGGRLALRAPAHEAELLRLGGLGVRVTGRRIAAGKESVFAVSGYELLPIDGVAPVVGIVAREGDAAMIRAHAGGDPTRLDGPLVDALLAHEGRKVWVWGTFPEDGGRGILTVKAYGVLGPGSGVIRR